MPIWFTGTIIAPWETASTVSDVIGPCCVMTGRTHGQHSSDLMGDYCAMREQINKQGPCDTVVHHYTEISSHWTKMCYVTDHTIHSMKLHGCDLVDDLYNHIHRNLIKWLLFATTFKTMTGKEIVPLRLHWLKEGNITSGTYCMTSMSCFLAQNA